MKILVTGHKGFIGSYLFKRLKKDGHEVIGYDKGDNLPKHEYFNVIYHLAAYPKALESIRQPHLALKNIELTFKILDWMRITGSANKIIFASSTEIPGLKTPYSASKFASENLIEAFCNSYGFGAISLRFSNIYGPKDRQDRFIPTIITQAKQNKEIKIYGKEGNFLYIDDCVDIYIEMQKRIELGKHKIYKITNHKSTLISLAKKVIELTHSKSKIKLENGLKKLIK